MPHKRVFFSVRPLVLFLLALPLALTASGCARLTASHLGVTPWQDGGAHAISAKFMRFDLQTQVREGVLRVKGAAKPVAENIPAWADTAEGLTLFAYLCDAQGAVVQSAQKTFPAQKIPADGFPFAFSFKPESPASGTAFVAMGYRVMFTPSRPPAKASPGSGPISGNYVFFANEQALLAR